MAKRPIEILEFHDAIFQTDRKPLDTSVIDEVAARVGLDSKQFRADRADANTRVKVAADLASGVELGVRGTPTVFINGRRIGSLDADALEAVLEHEFQSARR